MKFALLFVLVAGSYALEYTNDFTVEDAATLVEQLTLDEIKQLEAETEVVKEEKREIFGPDGKPIDLAQFGQVQIDPKSHFCCTQEHIQNKNWNTKDHTKTVYEYKHVTFKYKHGYTKCGTFAWSRCSLYKEGYAQQLFTYTQNVEIEDVKFCPDEHITCCHGFTKTADGGCLRLDDLTSNPQLGDSLCRMARLGLLKSHQRPENCPSDM